VNGVTKVNCNVKSDLKYGDATEDCINKLKQTINECNTDKHALYKNKKIVLIGDSNTKDYVCNLKTLLSNNYELYSAIKPGSSKSELRETAKEEVSQLSHDDVIIIICSGINDYELNFPLPSKILEIL